MSDRAQLEGPGRFRRLLVRALVLAGTAAVGTSTVWMLAGASLPVSDFPAPATDSVSTVSVRSSDPAVVQDNPRVLVPAHLHGSPRDPVHTRQIPVDSGSEPGGWLSDRHPGGDHGCYGNGPGAGCVAGWTAGSGRVHNVRADRPAATFPTATTVSRQPGTTPD